MLDPESCPCSGRNLAKLVRPAVLVLLLQDDLHGYDILQRLNSAAVFADFRPDHTAVYRALRSMEDEGLLSSSWLPSDTGPAKRRYTITSAGVSCARRWLGTLKDYHTALGHLVAMAAAVFEQPRG